MPEGEDSLPVVPPDKTLAEAQADLEGQLIEAKHHAALDAIEALGEELKDRRTSGKLKKELGDLRAGQVFYHLTKLIAALKGPAPTVAIQINKANGDDIRAFSPSLRTPHDRELLHKRMDRKRNE